MFSGPKYDFYHNTQTSPIFIKSVIPESYDRCKYITIMNDDGDEFMYSDNQQIIM